MTGRRVIVGWMDGVVRVFTCTLSSLSLSSTLLLSLPPSFSIFFPSSSLSPSLSAPGAFLFSSISIFLIYALSVLTDPPFCCYCFVHFLLSGAQGWH